MNDDLTLIYAIRVSVVAVKSWAFVAFGYEKYANLLCKQSYYLIKNSYFTV